jgi:transcription initiation factor TFIIIB Brf1 subunit/transcription initiation factor TFIIB
MKCKECDSTEIEFDERLGEKCCAGCGLVLVTGMFEETVHILNRDGDLKHSADKNIDKLGSIITGKGSFKFNRGGKNSVIARHITTGITQCKMVLGNLQLPVSLNFRIEKVYMELYRAHILRTFTLEERGTAIVYYLLKENRTPHSLKDVASEFKVNLKRTKKLIRKINQHYRNSIHYTSHDSNYLIQQMAGKVTSEPIFIYQANKVMEHFESKVIVSNFNKGRCYYAAICVMTSNIFVRKFSCKYIAERTGFHRNKITQEYKKILNLVGLDSIKQIKGKELEKIGE